MRITMKTISIYPIAILAAFALSACDRTVVTPPTTTVVPVAVPVPVAGPAGPAGTPGNTGAPGTPGADGTPGKPGNTIVVIPPPAEPPKN